MTEAYGFYPQPLTLSSVFQSHRSDQGWQMGFEYPQHESKVSEVMDRLDFRKRINSRQETYS